MNERNERKGFYKHPDLRLTAKEKWETFKRKAEEKTISGLRWVRDNWYYISAAATIVVPVVGMGIKAHNKHHDIKQQKMLKDRYIYDHSSGHYWKTSRKLKTSEWLELERRRKDQSLGEALRDMRLI